MYWLIVGTIAVWRVTHLLAVEDGPWRLLARLRRRAGAGFFAELLDCFLCLSLWIAAPAAWLIGDGWKERVFLWLALSGGAILLERITAPRDGAAAAAYREDPEEDHGLLREE